MEFVAIIVLLIVVGLLLRAGLPRGARRRTDREVTDRSPRPPRDPGEPIPGSAPHRHEQGKP